MEKLGSTSAHTKLSELRAHAERGYPLDPPTVLMLLDVVEKMYSALVEIRSENKMVPAELGGPGALGYWRAQECVSRDTAFEALADIERLLESGK